MKAVVASLMVCFCIALAGCSSAPSHERRQVKADLLAAANGWRSDVIASQPFQLSIWQPEEIQPDDVLMVYVEGDGLAWLSPTAPSDDPTPVHPVALQLALAQQDGNAVYIARPCQYEGIKSPHCQQTYWTGKRFAPQVIDSTNAAVDVLKQRFGAKKLVLIGYSGGAAVTALLAQRRDDVVGWITIAGNIDHRSWTQQNHMTPLTGSLDPMQNMSRLKSLPQWHFVGGRDEVVQAAPTRHFAASMQLVQVITIDDYDHHCCWKDMWASNLQNILRQLAIR